MGNWLNISVVNIADSKLFKFYTTNFSMEVHEVVVKWDGCKEVESIGFELITHKAVKSLQFVKMVNLHKIKIEISANVKVRRQKNQILKLPVFNQQLKRSCRNFRMFKLKKKLSYVILTPKPSTCYWEKKTMYLR